MTTQEITKGKTQKILIQVKNFHLRNTLLILRHPKNPGVTTEQKNKLAGDVGCPGGYSYPSTILHPNEVYIPKFPWLGGSDHPPASSVQGSK